MKYHAHVYFDLNETAIAELVLEAARKQTSYMQVHWLIPRTVGPHTKPMFEIHFHEHHKKKVLEWLKRCRKGLSVLVHPDTGNDLIDHQEENILWLGERLPLDFEFFHLVKEDPSKAIHQA